MTRLVYICSHVSSFSFQIWFQIWKKPKQVTFIMITHGIECAKTSKYHIRNCKHSPKSTKKWFLVYPAGVIQFRNIDIGEFLVNCVKCMINKEFAIFIQSSKVNKCQKRNILYHNMRVWIPPSTRFNQFLLSSLHQLSNYLRNIILSSLMMQ